LTGASAGSQPLPGRAGRERAGTYGGARGSRGKGDRVAPAVFALLVLACFVALLVTQRLKHTPTVVQAFKLTHVISPKSTGESREEHISFKLAKADRVTVTIVSSSGVDVATLVRDLPVPRYKQLSLRWNGRRGVAQGYSVLRRKDGYSTLLPVNRGSLAPPGEYRVQVSLPSHGPVLSPRSFKLVGR
jgi:hypothetical protein